MLRHGSDAATGVTGKQHLFIPPSQGQGTRKAQKQMLDMMGGHCPLTSCWTALG